MILMILNIMLVKKIDLKNTFNTSKPLSGGFFIKANQPKMNLR